MDNLFNTIRNWGIEPNIFLILLALSAAFLVAITALYICVPFTLFRIKKELIEMNKNLRTLHILNAKSKTAAITDAGGENKIANPQKSANSSSKFQLDDNDLKKLKATGFDIE